jgi:uncharacterized protein YuzE
MVITYDPQNNIAYFRFREPDGQIETVLVGTELAVDVTSDGKVFGIELLNANKQLNLQKDLILIHQATGARTVLSWAS